MDAGPRQTARRLTSGHWPIILILFIAAACRLNNITQPFVDDSAWRESSVAMMAQNFYRESWNIFYPEVNWVGPGPGYQGREFQTVSYITAILYTFFDQHDWVGRSVTVMFSLLGIFALYQLVRRVWGDERAIAAAALMALLPGVIRVDRSFLPDPAMVALVVTSFWMLVAYLQTDRPRYLILALLIGTLGNLTKLPGMIVGLPMAYAAVSILRQRQALTPKKIALLASAGLLSALPVAAYYIWARHLSVSYPPYHFAGEGNWVWDQGLKSWLEQGYFLTRLWKPLTVLWGLPVLSLLLVGLIIPAFAKNNFDEKTEAPWLFHWWLAAGAIYYFMGALELVENPSNLHILSPAVAALSADAIVFVSSFAARQARRPALSLVFALIIIAAVSSWGLRRSRLYSSYAEQSYELGMGLRSVSRSGDLVVTVGNLIGCPVAIYYSGRRGWLFPPYENIKDWESLPGDAEAIEIFEGLRGKEAKWFGIVNDRKDLIWKDRPGFARHIESTCEPVQANEHASIYRILTAEEVARLRK